MALTWAEKRRFTIIGSAVAAGLLLLAGVAFAIFYNVPSCMDGKKNQDESGIDCGGSCAYLCSAEVQAPRVTLARTLPNPLGRTDVIAYIENRNPHAEAPQAPYAVEVFDEAGGLLGRREGTIDLPARAVVPIFIPGIVQGIGQGTRAFVTFDTGIRWRTPKDEVASLRADSVEIFAGDRPRVVATLENLNPDTLYDRTIVATVFDASGSVVAASKTTVQEIPAQGSVEAVFTWNQPFPEGVLRAEVRPVPLLP